MATTSIGSAQHLGRVADAADRLDEHVDRDPDEQHGVGEGGQDLEPVEPERAVRAGRGARGELDGGQGHPESEDVGEHVAGVGQQGQRVGEEPADHLDDHEGGEHREGGGEAALVALARSDGPVGVRVPVGTAVHPRQG